MWACIFRDVIRFAFKRIIVYKSFQEESIIIIVIIIITAVVILTAFLCSEVGKSIHFF